MAYEIRPLHFGTLSVDKSGLTLRNGAGTRVPAPCIGWLILGGERPILVDTGPSDSEEWGTRFHNPLKRDASQALVAQLARHGIALESIGTVVLTHLHWDHCYGNDHLPDAEFVVQRREVEYARDPLPCDVAIYETDLPDPPFLRPAGRFRIVDGTVDLAPGLRIVPLPGHSPGLQGVLVEAAGDPWMIAADHMPLFENDQRTIPTGIVHSLEDWYRATRTIRDLGARVLPGHDERVLDREAYR